MTSRLNQDVVDARKSLDAWYTTMRIPVTYRLSTADVTSDIQYLHRVYGHVPVDTYVAKRTQLIRRHIQGDALYATRKARRFKFIQPRPGLTERSPGLRRDTLTHAFTPPWARQKPDF